MRFITEFNIHMQDAEDLGEFRKQRAQNGIGVMIVDAFGWDIKQHKVVTDKYILEIEAFPMDKWVEFKEKLWDALPEDYGPLCRKVMELIKELESFGKPSGDAITNLADQMEYRGPSSHCKACEDERAGIKHIQSQRHTCKK